MKDMGKKFIPIWAIFIFFWLLTLPFTSNTTQDENHIKRLTFSGNNIVNFPCVSDDGRLLLYVIEIKNGGQTTKALRVMNVESGEDRELFRNGERKGLPPFQDTPLEIGSKPPVLSGDGQKAVFSLSLGEPARLLDHYLAVVNTDGTEFWLTHFPIESLQGKNLKSLDFTSSNWERISTYAVSSDGNRIACSVKGHLGPRRYGNPSGVIFIDMATKSLKTILAPDFAKSGWEWKAFPRSPLLGGGWAFCMSANGERVVFGAQASEDSTDYDLYAVKWNEEAARKITDFHDRWFSLADISNDGEKVVFFYNGRKKQGIGTYCMNTDGSGLKFLESKKAPRVELADMSGNGRYILFKHVYRGMILDLDKGTEKLAFDEETAGYIKGIIPMDFPRFPSFWCPKILSFKGDRALLIGPPQGKESPEIYLLTIGLE